jgi:hypothetical protein
MRGGVLVCLCATAACNLVYDLEETKLAPAVGGGTDIDLDSIEDTMDPCIAAMLDAEDDYDSDSIPVMTDPCPFDEATSPNGNPDTDGDGVNDACDPFPMMAGDSRRCTMRFYNTDLNSRLWKETDATPAWSSTPGSLYVDDQDSGMASSLASTLDLERGVAEPTFDVATQNSARELGAVRGIRVWVRAADPASRDDIGCEVFGDQTYTRIAIALGDGRDLGTPMMLTGTPFPLASALRIRVTVIPAEGTIRCTVSRYPDRWTVTATSPFPMGTLGFGAEGLQLQVTGLAIYDRTAVVAVP